jgi:hypothetical protein
MTEGVVGNQQEPALAALRDDGTGCADRLGICIERPVKARRRAILIGEPRCCRSGEQRDLPFLLGDLLDCQRNSRIGKLRNRTHPVDVKPTSRDGRGYIRFVLMIADDDLDRFSTDFAAEILCSHARGIDRSLASKICVGPGLVVENPDTFDAAGALCIHDAIEK